MKWLLLCVLVLASCRPKLVDADELNAKEQARLQAQADREKNKP